MFCVFLILPFDSFLIGIETAKLAVELDESNYRAHQWYECFYNHIFHFKNSYYPDPIMRNNSLHIHQTNKNKRTVIY